MFICVKIPRSDGKETGHGYAQDAYMYHCECCQGHVMNARSLSANVVINQPKKR
jgi:hypothetical protein